MPLKKHPVTNGSTSLWGHDRHGLVLAAQDSHIRDGYTGHRDRKSCQKFGLLASKISKIWNDWEGVDFFRNIIMSIPQADSETVQWQKRPVGIWKMQLARRRLTAAGDSLRQRHVYSFGKRQHFAKPKSRAAMESSLQYWPCFSRSCVRKKPFSVTQNQWPQKRECK